MIHKIAWIYLSEGHLLSSRSRGRKKYYIPGGKREAGEQDSDTLCREILEECSVNLLLGSIKFVGSFQAQADGHIEGLMVQMTCYSAEYDGVLSPGAEIEELIWLTHADIPYVSPVDQLIIRSLNQQGLML